MNIKKRLKSRLKYNHYSRLMWEVHEFLIAVKGVGLFGSSIMGRHEWVMYTKGEDGV